MLLEALDPFLPGRAIAHSGGYGDPRARDLESLERDLEEGYVSAAGARGDDGADG